MAIYRLETNLYSRGKGHKVVAASAYCAGSKMYDEYSRETHDNSDKAGVWETRMVYPENAPEWTQAPETFWNAVERGERRKDAQTGRWFILSLPRELSHEQQLEAVLGWVDRELTGKGRVSQISFHDEGDGNPHCHVITSMRVMDGDKLSTKKLREWNEILLLRHWRKTWCEAENTALEAAGRPERVDHRSLKDRGIDREPEPKIGQKAAALKKRSVVADPWRCQLVRWVRTLNSIKPLITAIKTFGEVREHGFGAWWERSLMLASETAHSVGQSIQGRVSDALKEFKRNRSAGPPELSGPEPILPDHDIDVSL